MLAIITNDAMGRGDKDKIRKEESELIIDPFLFYERNLTRRPYLKLFDPDLVELPLISNDGKKIKSHD